MLPVGLTCGLIVETSSLKKKKHYHLDHHRHTYPNRGLIYEPLLTAVAFSSDLSSPSVKKQ